MSAHDYANAITAYDAAVSLDVNDSALTAKYQTCADTARSSFSDAVSAARSKLEAGQSYVSSRDWESAIESFRAGLAVDGAADESLMSSLRGGLESAESSKRDREAAVRDTKSLLSEGEAALASRSYAEAISSLESALLLDVQNDSLTASMQESLSSARSGLAAEESSRAEASLHASTGDACMSSHDYVRAMDAFELAVAVDVNEAALTAKYQTCDDTARS